MYEPSTWCDWDSPNEEYVCDNIKNTEFYICLHKAYNTERDNEALRFLLNKNVDSYTGTRSKYITYESIRKIDDWKSRSVQILMEEVVNHKPYGSYRGFGTFVFAPLYKRYIIRVIIEIWAQSKIASLARIWVERHLRPDGAGYRNVKKQWEDRLKEVNN